MEKALEGNQALLKGEAEEFVSSWYADIAYKGAISKQMKTKMDS
ncbi:hypothetical protein [Helicobacter apodemus]|nr:hypothetical protein [Helicobacter apodemus]